MSTNTTMRRIASGAIAAAVLASSGLTASVASAAVAYNGFARLELNGNAGGWQAVAKRQGTGILPGDLGHLQLTGPGMNLNGPDQATFHQQLNGNGRGSGTICATTWFKQGGGYANVGRACLNV